MLQQRLLGRMGTAATLATREPPPKRPQSAVPGSCCQGWTRCSWPSSENICTGFWDGITAFKALIDSACGLAYSLFKISSS